MLTTLKPASFACPRTCTPNVECLFGPIFRALGPTKVVSHTTKVVVQFNDRSVLAAAVAAMGGTMLGEGSHRLYGGSEQGLGFNLPGWRYPLILKADGSLAFDSYNGHWGNEADIPKLKGQYTIAVAAQAAAAQGWMTQTEANGSLVVFHPDGGTITVFQDGTVDAMGFVGTGCDAAQIIELSIGRAGSREDKPEYFDTSAFVSL